MGSKSEKGGSNTTMKVLVVGLSPALDQVLVLGESVKRRKYSDLIGDTEVREASP